jgi:rifampin ADP-ribosylating transferase
MDRTLSNVNEATHHPLSPNDLDNPAPGLIDCPQTYTAALESAIWGCELAQREGRERIYVVEAVGEYFDDPNLTDKKFPGNPTQSYRSREALRILGEVTEWQGHPPEQRQAMKDNVARLRAEKAEIID